jgi:hypothetical protein
MMLQRAKSGQKPILLERASIAQKPKVTERAVNRKKSIKA